MRILAAAAAVLMLLAGCGESAATPSGEMRIVSLTPALSQMLVDLGLGPAIVAVSENDDVAPAGLPVVGTFIDVDLEKLAALRPTHVAMMHGKEGVPPSLAALARDGEMKLAAYAYPVRLADVLRVLTGPVEESPPLGQFVDRPQPAGALADRVRGQLQQLKALTAEREKPRVLLAFAVQPVMASGAGTVLDELLAAAGGVNAAAGEGLTAPTYDREALLRLRPDVILLLMPGAPPLTDGDARLAAFASLPIPAVEQGRIALINDPHVLLPSTQMPRIAAAMVAAIHPDLTEEAKAVVEAGR